MRFIEFGKSKVGEKWGWQRRYAELLGISPAQLNNILAGRDSLGPGIRERLAARECNPDWLLTGKGQMVVTKKQIEFPDVDLVKIPVFEYARAGLKSMVLAEKPSYSIATIKSKDESRFAVVVKGKSMEPEIKDGELVVVSKKKEMKNGDVCLVMFEDGDACLRRVYCHDHAVTLTSANEREYPPSTHKKSEIRSIYRMVQKITNY